LELQISYWDVRFILPVTTVGMADMVIPLTAPIMFTHLTDTDPMEITAGGDIMDGVVDITEATVGVAVMAGTATAGVDTVGAVKVMVEADMDGVVDMVTTNTYISGTGIGSVFVAVLV
jgi:hypothetical protein